jgi:DNA-binding SARP family transcriptional activator/TolB-like protein
VGQRSPRQPSRTIKKCRRGAPAALDKVFLPQKLVQANISETSSPSGCNVGSISPRAQGAVITSLRSPLLAAGSPDGAARPLLRVTLFGQMQAEDSGGHSVLPRSRKTRAVLAVLALAGSRQVLRTRLTGLLWSRRGSEQARASLRQSVHELQRALGSHAAALLRADRNHLVLNEDRLWVDASVLAKATATAPQGLELFQPSLLDDLTNLDPAFDRWIADERLRMTQSARLVAEQLLVIHGDVRSRIAAAERLLAIDPVHEGAWQALIQAHIDRSDRAAARSAAERCRATFSFAGLNPSRDIALWLGSLPLGRLPALSGLQRSEPAQNIRLVVQVPRVLDRAGSDFQLAGFAEEITVAVSRFRWISCAAGVSAPAMDGTEAAEPRAWQRHDVDYLLDSTVQHSENRLRIISRLLDVHDGGQVVWAHRIDQQVQDALTLQGEIAGEMAAQIDPVLLLREGKRLVSRQLDDPTAYVLVHRAIPAIYRLEPSSFHAAGAMLGQAVAIDPGNAPAHAWWAYWHLLLVGQGWANDPLAAALRAGELAECAVMLDPCDARALTLVGHVRGFLHKRAEEACALHERALSLNANLPLAWCFYGFAHCYLGNHDEAIRQISHAQRLSPHDPHAFFFDMALMMPLFLRGDFEQAMIAGRRAIELNPSCSSTYKGYLATLGHLGRVQEAALLLARLLALEPKFSVKGAIERSPMTRADDLALYADGLRLAGLREG